MSGRRSRAAARIVGVLLAVAVLGAACGNGGDDEPAAEQPPAAEQQTDEVTGQEDTGQPSATGEICSGDKQDDEAEQDSTDADGDAAGQQTDEAGDEAEQDSTDEQPTAEEQTTDTEQEPAETPEATETTPEATAAPQPTAAPQQDDDSSSAPEPEPAATAEIIEDDARPTGDLAAVSRDWATNFGRRTIDLDELAIGISGLQIRDRIEPIDDPLFTPVVDAADRLNDREPGLVLTLDGAARFYPLSMLIRHEIVNDETPKGCPVLVTYCPLCNSALVFDPVVDGRVLRFGTSGLLRMSDLVMWDDATESLWQQIGGEALVGELAGRRLELLPSAIASWGQFQSRHPDGEVLTPAPGREGGYGYNPYVGYTSRSAPYGAFFDSDQLDDRYPALERTVGVVVAGQNKAYPFSVVAPQGAVNDTLAGTPLVVFWAPGTSDPLDTPSTAEGQDAGTATVFDRRHDGMELRFSSLGDGQFQDDATGSIWDVLGLAVSGPLAGAHLTPVTHTNEFWFAWAAFHQGSPVYTGR